MNQVVKKGSVAGVSRITVNSSLTTTSAGTTTITSFSGTQAPVPSGTRPALSSKSIENAVYGHIRAVRALGRTEILPSEIAAALSIPPSAVIEALTALQNKGIKFNK